MKAHLTAAATAASLPLPPPKPPSFSSSSSSFAAEDNPQKEFGFSDPVFDIVLQDRESETESTNPTRKRSKRDGKPPETVKKSPEEDLALCLMMLSRDRWIQNQNQNENQKLKAIGKRKKCEKCRKQFRSYRALFSHENICRLETELEEEEEGNDGRRRRRRMFKCPFCMKNFGSGQALGGHKRSHILSSTTTNNSSVSFKLQISLIDLNLPAPIEEHDYTLVSHSSQIC